LSIASEPDDDSSDGGDDPDGDGAGTTGMQAGTAMTSLSVTRAGFIVLSFHAERGLSTAVEAGVKWSQSVSFRDSITLEVASQSNQSAHPTQARAACSDGFFKA
jgi:hypothetical protein